jgi:hypothetical protein
MKRLRELDGSSALLERAQTLIASVDAIPDSPERMLRIRRELDVPRAALGIARGVPAWSAAGVVLMFGASVFAAVRLFGAVGSGGAPPTAAPSAAPSGQTAHAGGPSMAAAIDRESLASAEVGAVQAQPRSAHAVSPRERHAAAQVRSRHATQLSARVSSRTHALRHHALASPAPAAARSPSDAANALSGASAEAELAPNSAAAPVMNAASGSDALSSNAISSAPAHAELSSNSPAKSDLAARDPERAASPPQPSAADDETSPQTGAVRAPTTSDSELVHRALKALRHDHDPALAARLLDQQRAAVHGGPLAEEALALQIEATSSLRQVRSRDFAREYLARYPNGRYRSVAEKALQDPQL